MTDNWMDEELASFSTEKSNATSYPEPLKLIENKITEVEIDFSAKFEKKPNKLNPNTMQALIPCSVAGVKKTFWLNVANPLYHELITAGKAGTKKFKILKTGSKKDTRYTIVTD